MRFFNPLLLLACLAVLAGCAENADAPRAPAPNSPAALARQAPVTVIVQGVYGAPDGVSERLAAAMTVALQNEGVAAGIIPQPTSYTLAGSATAKQFPNDVEVRIVWYLLDPRGLRVASIEQVARGRDQDWQAAADRIISRIAIQGAPNLAGMVNKQIGAPNVAAAPAQPNPAPAPAKGPRVQLVSITGAPGDGNGALASAMRKALSDRGFTLSDKVEGFTLVLKAKVEVAAVDNGRERLTIVWSVLTANGKLLGDITQSNVIPAGVLGQKWGVNARDIALAATEGVVELLDQGAKQAPQ